MRVRKLRGHGKLEVFLEKKNYTFEAGVKNSDTLEGPVDNRNI